jgi:sugar lactone lactonase YvrE
MNMKRSWKAIVLVIALAFSTAAYSQNIYWVDGVAGRILSSSESGSSQATIVAGIGAAYGIQVDIPTNRIYWADNTSKTIQCSFINGSNIQTLITQAAGGIVMPRGLALNIAGSKIYWADNGTGKIMSAGLDGSSVSTLVSGLDSPGFMAFDSQNNKVYWADNGSSAKKIQRCQTDGTGLETVVTGLNQVWGMALDVQAGMVYWIDSGIDKIQKGSLAVLPVTPVDVIPNLPGAQRGMTIDKQNNYLLWSSMAGTIERAALDGTGQTSIATGLINPQGIAIDGNFALPVELRTFTAACTKAGVKLIWTTATEVNFYGFDIERTAGGIWQKIGFVQGSGTTNAPQSYGFVDASAAGTVEYRLKQIDRDGKFAYSKEVEATPAGAPAEFAQLQNYPNPFNPSTTISFTVPSNGPATLKIFNAIGQEVATLFTGEVQAGMYNHVRFNASNLPSGMYFSRLEYNGKTQLKKMELIK